MAHSSLLGIDTAPTYPSGRDTDLLGPSDSSDTGSDMAGLSDTDDPTMPVDVALDADRPHALGSPDASTSDSDGAGTGERRSAVGDAGGRDGADILPDHIIDPDGDGETDFDPDLDRMADIATADERESIEDDDEDEAADPASAA